MSRDFLILQPSSRPGILYKPTAYDEVGKLLTTERMQQRTAPPVVVFGFHWFPNATRCYLRTLAHCLESALSEVISRDLQISLVVVCLFSFSACYQSN